MDRASSLIFPGSRTLAGWWRQLQPYQPRSLLVGYVYVHRVEAPVRVQHQKTVDALAQLVLKALTLQLPTVNGNASDRFEGMSARLGLPPSILQQIIVDMEKTGLLERSSSHSCHMTEIGRMALDSGRFPVQMHQRRVFAFLENLTALGDRSDPPRFVPLAECLAAPWRVAEGLGFDPALLQGCIAQSVEWKKQWSFPLDVEALDQTSTSSSWQQVIVDRPERVLMVVIQTGPAMDWLGFAAKADGWVLLDQDPILRLAATTAMPEWSTPPAVPVWQEVWRSWCRQRNLPPAEAEICTLSHRPPRLDIQAPERFVQRLRAAKSDLLRGEAWVLVGDGYLRTAALLSLPSASANP